MLIKKCEMKNVSTGDKFWTAFSGFAKDYYMHAENISETNLYSDNLS